MASGDARGKCCEPLDSPSKGRSAGIPSWSDGPNKGALPRISASSSAETAMKNRNRNEAMAA